MKLSTKGRYGTRAMLDLALHYGQGPVPLKEIAHREDVPLQYLERLMAPLIAAGIAKSTRGARGGVYLLKERGHIKRGDSSSGRLDSSSRLCRYARDLLSLKLLRNP